jgi:metal-responsive CopG/Arc/MetJ family transcriptional regulator
MKQIDAKDPTSVRASVSFPHNDYKKVEKIAADKHVSVAWVVREAVIEYLKKAKEE